MANEVPYPRPMLERSAWVSLDGDWDYAVRLAAGDVADDPIVEPEPAGWDGTIRVPYAIEWEASGVARPLLPWEVLFYRRRVAIPEGWRGGRVAFNFEAVDHRCVVRIDGEVVGGHRGGYLPFSVELPDTTRPEVEVVVVVRDETGLQQRGKQSLTPSNIWYTATSGIWGPVWMEPLPARAIRQVTAVSAPGLDSLVVTVDAEAPGPVTVRVEGASEVDGVTGRPIRIPVPGPRPWSPSDPHLYRLSVACGASGGGTAEAAGQAAGDTVTSWAALRTVGVGPIPGAPGARDAILLNGEPIFLNTPLWQGYWPATGLTAPSDDALVADLEAVRDMGFNGVRVHVKVESRRFYHAADRLGLLVVQDAVSGGRPFTGLRGSGIIQATGAARVGDRSRWFWARVGRSDAANRQEFTDELAQLVAHLAGHPCVVMWVPFNEAWGQFDARGAEALVRRLDPTRLVDQVSGWFDQGGGDVVSRHRYVLRLRPPPGRGRKDRRPFSLSEFGGLNLAVPGHVWGENSRFGYRFLEDADALAVELTRLYREELIPLVGAGLRAATYTQVADVETETNGLLTYDREVVKVPVELMRRLNGELYAALADVGNAGAGER